MMKRILIPAFGLRLLIAAMAVAFAPSATESLMGVSLDNAHAEEEQKRKKKPRSVPNMNETTYKRLSEVQELMDAEQTDEAILKAEEMVERSRRYNGNELGQIHNILAALYFNKENMEQTIYHYEQVLAQVPDISEGVETGTIYNLAKLYFIDEQYDKAIAYIEDWFTKAENPDPNAYFFMGQVYYQQGKYDEAIDKIELAISIGKERGLTIRENWWSMLRFLYYEQENWDKVLEILEILVRVYPSRAYWLQLAGIYGQLEMEDKQLLTMEAAHVGGFLEKETDLVNYSGLLLQAEVPWRAGKYLQDAVDSEVVESNAKNLQQLGQAYQLAYEVDDAIETLEAAGEKSDDGTIYDRLASLYLDKDRFAECETAAQRALDKGDLKRVYNTEIVLGMCQFNQDRLEEARETFRIAGRHAREAEEERAEEQCRNWISYIDSEKRRREALDI